MIWLFAAEQKKGMKYMNILNLLAIVGSPLGIILFYFAGTSNLYHAILCTLLIIVIMTIHEVIAELAEKYIRPESLGTCVMKCKMELKPQLLLFGTYILAGFFASLGPLALIIIYCFTALLIGQAKLQFFSPFFAILGFRTYYITTSNGTSFYLLTQKNIKGPADLDYSKIHRLDDGNFFIQFN